MNDHPQHECKHCQATPTRRGIVRLLVGGTAALFTGALGLLCGAGFRFMMPNTVNEPAKRFRAGRPSDYRKNYVDTRYKEEFGTWIVCGKYDGQEQIYALSTRCTHLGCITIWQESDMMFKCPCHGSGFTISGENFEGPAPRPLERFAVRIADDGQIEVDRSHIFREELGQWNDPESFIPV